MSSITNIFNKVKSSFKKAETKFIRSQYLVIIIPVIVVLLAFLLYVPYLFNNNNLRFQLEQKISQYTKGNLEIKGQIKISALPSPAVSLNEIILRNYIKNNNNYNIYIKNAKIKLSFFKSLLGHFAMKEITFSDIIIEKINADNPLEIKSDELINITKSIIDKKNQQGIGGNLFSINSLNLHQFSILNLPNIIINNLKLISYSKLGNKREINNLNGQFTFSPELITGTGSYKNQNIVNSFKINLKPKSQERDSIIEITSSFANLKIYGTFFNHRIKKQPEFGNFFRATLESEIFNLKDFYKSFISNKGYVFNKINPNTNSVKLKSGIKKQGSEITLDSISINSNLINGRGNINIDFSSQIPIMDIQLTLENVDMDSIWLLEKQADDQINDAIANKNLRKTKNIEQKSLDLTKDFRDIDLTLEMKVSRIRYLAEEIKNVDIYTAISKQGEILILPLKLEVPGSGKFRISGVIENRNNTPKFIGKIDAKGEKLADLLRWMRIGSQNLKYNNLKNYSIYSDLLLKPNTTIFNNFYLNINDQNTELLGEMKIDYNNRNSNIISNFEVHNLDIDNYFLTSAQNIYLSPGNLLKKILWLNNLTSRHDITLEFDRLKYKNLSFKNQSLKTRFGPGYLEIDKLKLESDNFDLETSLAIDITELNPRFDISLRSEKFDYKPSTQNIENTTQRENNEKLSINFADQFFALPSLENFYGDLLIDFKNANFSGLKAQDLKIKAKLRKGVLDFSEFTSKIYNGDFKLKGSAAIKFDKSISANINLKNSEIKPLLKDLTNIEKIDGLANISASISSYGNKTQDFIKNINADAKFSAANISLKNYGLNDLVKKMFNPFYFQAELEDPKSILSNKDAKTSLNKASGAISIKRGSENKYKIDFSGVAINGITSGKFDLLQQKIDGSSNIIFLTGTKKKQIPINILTNYKGKFNNILSNTNMTQALQYIAAVKKQIENGATELKFKENPQKAKKDQPKRKDNNQPNQDLDNQEIVDQYLNKMRNNSLENQLSPEQMQMLERSFPGGVQNIEMPNQ